MPESSFKASLSTNTILGVYHQMNGMHDFTVPYNTYLDATLNTKYSIKYGPGVNPTLCPATMPLGKNVKVKYFGIGIKGFYNIDDGILSQPYMPKATNLDLHQPIPFRCVPVDSDLSAQERSNYRMRTRITVDGEQYYAYWLKKITYVEPRVKITQITPDNQEIPYTIDPSNLYPVPSKTEVQDVLDCDTDRVVVSTTGQCEVLGSEVIEAINVLHGGDLRMARVSEFGFYTGEDAVVQETLENNTTLSFTEAMYVHLATHRCTLGTDLSDPTGYHLENIIYESGSMVLL